MTDGTVYQVNGILLIKRSRGSNQWYEIAPGVTHLSRLPHRNEYSYLTIHLYMHQYLWRLLEMEITCCTALLVSVTSIIVL